MDRQQAYEKLISHLLWCDDEEMEILQQHINLLDRELLGAMNLKIRQLEQRKKVQTAQRLRHIQQLATELIDQLSQPMGIGTIVRKEAEGLESFLLDTLELVWDSQGNPQQVYLFWEAQLEKLTNPQLLEVFHEGLCYLEKNQLEKLTDPQLLESSAIVAESSSSANIGQLLFAASALERFGNLIWQFPLGTRWLNQELAISAGRYALRAYARCQLLTTKAAIQYNLGNIYVDRISGNLADNYEQAIRLYEEALEIFKRDEFPEEWARIQSALAYAYLARIQGDRTNNLEWAIELYTQVLSVGTSNISLTTRATTQHGLATAYSERIYGNPSDNVEQAIALYKQALKILDPNTSPEDWIATQTGLATAYKKRIVDDREDNLEQAIAVYREALQWCSCSLFSDSWATIQINLGVAYAARIKGEREDNLEQAIEAFQQALRVYLVKRLRRVGQQSKTIWLLFIKTIPVEIVKIILNGRLQRSNSPCKSALPNSIRMNVGKLLTA